jgi:glycosyltransferase involved in cell wall biosynthesis
MNYPKISIITVTYNAADGLHRTLENIARSNYPDFEVIVIDGASTDDTPQVAKTFSARIDRWVSEPDGGIYDAMNKGLQLATGEYVWFINAGDTIHEPETITRMFDSHPAGADIYYGETLIRSERGEVLGLRKKRLPERMTWRDFRRGMVVCHQSILVRRTIAPLYDRTYRYAADVEWVLLALQRAASIVNTRTILSEFELGGVSTRHRKSSLKERYAIMTRYFGIPATWLAHIGFLFDALKPPCRKIRK